MWWIQVQQVFTVIQQVFTVIFRISADSSPLGTSSSNQRCQTATLPTAANPLTTISPSCTTSQPCALCKTPYLCNPFPLFNGKDYSRAYCNEAPYVNVGTGQWSKAGLSFQIFNPFVDVTLQPPPVTFAKNQDYGAINCRLGCNDNLTPELITAFYANPADTSLPDKNANLCPYRFPKTSSEANFDPTLNSGTVGVPVDYIPYQVLNALRKTAQQNIQCTPVNPKAVVGVPPVDKPYCFDCSVLEEPPFSYNVPLFQPQFIVFNSLNGPNVVGLLWAIFIFEHLVLVIKVFVMAVVPDISDDVQELIDGQHEYLENQALLKDRKIAGAAERKIPLKASAEDAKIASQQVDAPIETHQDLLWNPPSSIFKRTGAGPLNETQLQTVRIITSDV